MQYGSMELKLSQSSHPFPFKSSSIYKHFIILPKRCKYQIQEIFSKSQHLYDSKQFLVHAVKQDETLNSISKLYGVPTHEIAAANKQIIVFEGQHLNIPSSITASLQTCQREKMIRLPKFDVSDLKLHAKDINRKMLCMLSSLHLPYAKAKTSGYFLVVVPLVAFCITCILNAFHNRAARNKSQVVHQASGSIRWKLALRDLSDPDTDFRPEIDNVSDDGEQLQSEELSRAYAKLDDDYQKFLAECGMSKFGYWRGGSSE